MYWYVTLQVSVYLFIYLQVCLFVCLSRHIPTHTVYHSNIKFKLTITFVFIQNTPGPGSYAKTFQTPLPETIKKMGRNYGLFFTCGEDGKY